MGLVFILSVFARVQIFCKDPPPHPPPYCLHHPLCEGPRGRHPLVYLGQVKNNYHLGTGPALSASEIQTTDSKAWAVISRLQTGRRTASMTVLFRCTPQINAIIHHLIFEVKVEEVHIYVKSFMEWVLDDSVCWIKTCAEASSQSWISHAVLQYG